MSSVYAKRAREALGIPLDKHEAVYVVYGDGCAEDDIHFFTSHSPALKAVKKLLIDFKEVHVENIMLYADWYDGPRHPGFYLLYDRQMAKDKKDLKTLNVMGEMMHGKE